MSVLFSVSTELYHAPILIYGVAVGVAVLKALWDHAALIVDRERHWGGAALQSRIRTRRFLLGAFAPLFAYAVFLLTVAQVLRGV